MLGTMVPMPEESIWVTSVKLTNILLVPSSISCRNWLSIEIIRGTHRRDSRKVNDDDIGGMADKKLRHIAIPLRTGR